MKVRATIISLALALVALTLLPALSYAWDEPHGDPELIGGSAHGGPYDCPDCHRPDVIGPSQDCNTCHAGTMTGTPSPEEGKGPHGIYSSNSDRCDACHTVHDAAGSDLLPSATVTGTCYSCHDGTGGRGVFGTIAARGLVVGAKHRIDTTSVVPGGDAASGGSATMTFAGPGNTLGCDDCHSPHDSSTVASFTAERKRTTMDRVGTIVPKTTRLLRRNPGGSTATATVYGSDWCLACHKGRTSAGPVHNHPVDAAGTNASPFDYSRAAVLNADTMTSVTTTGTLARTNRGYLMPWPRTSQQSGHSPICQQCHEDSRFVGTLSADGLSADAATFSVTATDGNVPGDNPRFQNFPHETQNTRFLVETNDDLCTNCHPTGVLP